MSIRGNSYVNSKLVLQHTRRVQTLFKSERVAMVTPDQIGGTILVKHVSRPFSEAKTCPLVPSPVDMVGRNAATISTMKHRTALLTMSFGFRYMEGESYHWFRLNRTIIATDEVSAKLMCMSKRGVTFTYEEKLWTVDLIRETNFAKTFSLSLMIWLS